MKIELDTEEAIKVMVGLRITIKNSMLDGDLERVESYTALYNRLMRETKEYLSQGFDTN